MASGARLVRRLESWAFSEPLLASLPLDKETENYVRRNVARVVFSVCHPTPLKTPRRLVAVSKTVLEDILDMESESIVEDKDFVDFVAGNKVLQGSIPMSHRYGGHQFGSWAGQLGDGRAHLLGEYINNRGERWELQLKGSGQTPYSRFGDGRAVLRSSIREFVASEAMFHLGVPTSRAASLVVTDDPVPRDMFYNGNVKLEKAAVVLRLAPTWFRFGSFEILAKHAEIEELRALTDFILQNTFPELLKASNGDKEDAILSMFADICSKTARLVAHWMAVGFAHGVLNTDNMSIGSITIDYGPYGFVDNYDPFFVPNTSDDFGRYDLQNQPKIAHWNLNKLAKALAPLLSSEKQGELERSTALFLEQYEMHRLHLFRRKLGIPDDNGLKEREDKRLIQELLDIMERKRADFTQTFSDLSDLSRDNLANMEGLNERTWALASLKGDSDFESWVKDYLTRTESLSDSDRLSVMQNSNPRYVLRNWMAQRAIEMAEAGDFSEVTKLLRVLKNPFKIQDEAEQADYARPPPKWAKHIGVSCSS